MRNTVLWPSFATAWYTCWLMFSLHFKTSVPWRNKKYQWSRLRHWILKFSGKFLDHFFVDIFHLGIGQFLVAALLPLANFFPLFGRLCCASTGTHYGIQVGLKLAAILLASASVLGLQAWVRFHSRLSGRLSLIFLVFFVGEYWKIAYSSLSWCLLQGFPVLWRFPTPQHFVQEILRFFWWTCEEGGGGPRSLVWVGLGTAGRGHWGSPGKGRKV